VTSSREFSGDADGVDDAPRGDGEHKQRSDEKFRRVIRERTSEQEIEQAFGDVGAEVGDRYGNEKRRTLRPLTAIELSESRHHAGKHAGEHRIF